MTRSWSQWMGRLQKNWRSAGKRPRRKSRGELFSCAAEVAECLEPRRLLTINGTLQVGADTAFNWNGPSSVTGPQVNGISEAMSSDGTKVVMVVADATPT